MISLSTQLASQPGHKPGGPKSIVAAVRGTQMHQNVPRACAATPARESSESLETRWGPAAARTAAWRGQNRSCELPAGRKMRPPRCATTPAEESSDFLETRWVPAAARTTAFRGAKSLLGAARGSQTVPPQVRKNARTGDQQVFGNSLGSRCSEDSSQLGPKSVHKAMFVISDITFKVTFRSVT